MAENNQNNPNNKKRTGLGAMFIILLFIAIIGIIVGVTINGRSRVDKSFSDVDLVLVKSNTTNKPSVDETNSSGEMYELFYKNAENSKPTFNIAHSVYTNDIYYISGNYTEGTKTRSYSGTLSKGRCLQCKLWKS